MKHLKVLLIILMFGALPVLQAEEVHANVFTDFFSFIGSLFGGGEEDDTSAQQPINDSEVVLTFGNVTYEETPLLKRLNERDDSKNYSQQMNLTCLYIETDTNKSFTMEFNQTNGEIANLLDAKACDTTVTVEEALVLDLQENGFNKSKIPTYMSQAQVPTGLYMKAAQVFGSLG